MTLAILIPMLFEWIPCLCQSQWGMNCSGEHFETNVLQLTNDMGSGSTVPDEQLSHGCDSSNMSGHAIPAMLCSNQYAVLFDAEPTEDEILHGV